MQSQLLFATMASGVVLRVGGRGTMQESPAFRTAAEVALQQGDLVCDASPCNYLDSTFLGCLVGVRKIAEQLGRSFRIVADDSKQIQLFSLSALNKYFDFVEQCPTTMGEWIKIEPDDIDIATLSRHILACHQRLAERGGTDGEAFKRVVQRLSSELGD